MSRDIASNSSSATIKEAKSSLLDLPNEVLEQICRALSIFDLYNLRRTSYRLASVVTKNSKYICGHVSRNTFSLEDRVIQHERYMCLSRPTDFAWLNDLVLHYLAAVIVDRMRMQPSDGLRRLLGIPANDERSYILRSYVVEGLEVIQELSRISRNIHGSHPLLSFFSFKALLRYKSCPSQLYKENAPLAWSSLRLRSDQIPGTSPFHQKIPKDYLENEESQFKVRTQLILGLRCKYLRSLSRERLFQLRFACDLLHSMIKTKYDGPTSNVYGPSLRRHVPCEYTGPDYFDWKTQEGDTFRLGQSWVHWCLLDDGLRCFWLQWCGHKSPSYVKDYLVHEWNIKSEQQHSLERNAAIQLDKLLRDLTHPKLQNLFNYIPRSGIDKFWDNILEYHMSLTDILSRSSAEMRAVPWRVYFRDAVSADLFLV
ncbi:hypothetical protein BT63DRAFT_410450 [Microthyrium microscopicum]|uniref:F-box domain-containing protein n=1 Tax=Microthyrium microscopicum TaxID=703497 RepID=A0A6A6UMH7_9PEZI|nr:hypothetical protein BT63DRAFT_410450 [Microthyrium microscopicum]